ncbi:MAG: hypothetical protein ABIA77_01335 [Candidatus Omnitrophota bacterium]
MHRPADIVIADDNVELCELITEILAESGHGVDSYARAVDRFLVKGGNMENLISAVKELS